MAQIQNLEEIMGLIMYGGDAKGNAVEAIRSAKVGNLVEAQEFLKKANESLKIAHNSQTSMLAKEALGNSQELSLLMVHGQDHLMTALTFIDLAKEVVEIYERIENLGG